MTLVIPAHYEQDSIGSTLEALHSEVAEPFQALVVYDLDEDPTLAVETGLDGPGEDEPREEAGRGVGDRQGRHLVGERIPTRLGVDRQAGVQPARDDGAAIELGAESRRDGDASLVVNRVPVLAGEHLSGFPRYGFADLSTGGLLRSTRGLFPHFGPLHATSRHHSAWG